MALALSGLQGQKRSRTALPRRFVCAVKIDAAFSEDLLLFSFVPSAKVGDMNVCKKQTYTYMTDHFTKTVLS